MNDGNSKLNQYSRLELLYPGDSAVEAQVEYVFVIRSSGLVGVNNA
jgi:hypothetical protein